MDGTVTNEISAALAAAWNQHDMEAFASHFHVDAAFVNIRGGYLRGREEIEQQHKAIHAGVYKDSTMRITVEDSNEVAPGLIVAHFK